MKEIALDGGDNQRDRIERKRVADKDAERIKYETEVAKTTILVAVAAAGSSLGLLLGEHTPLRLGLASVGIIVTVVLVSAVWRLDRRIRRLIESI